MLGEIKEPEVPLSLEHSFQEAKLRSRDSLNKDNRGVAELSELLVATMLVVVALGLFMTSIGGMLVTQTQIREDARSQAEAEDFCQLVRSSPLLSGEEPGVIPFEKMEQLTAEDLTREYPSVSQGFHYSIIVEDTSTYEHLPVLWVNTTDKLGNIETINITSGVNNTDDPVATEVWEGNTYASSLPVLIIVGSLEKHTGRLTVIIWGDGR